MLPPAHQVPTGRFPFGSPCRLLRSRQALHQAIAPITEEAQ